MFFAVNPWAPDVISRCLESVTSTSSGEANFPFILIDGAFDETFFDAPIWRHSTRYALYDQTALAALGKVGLWLVVLKGDKETVAEHLTALHARAYGKPMWSLLVSSVAADALVQHLRPYLLARTADGLEWPVRWGDTRVLPSLLAALTDVEGKQLMAPLRAWHYLDRQGEVQRLQGLGLTEVDSIPSRIWELDDKRFHALVDAGEADHILSRIDDVRPDLLRHDTPARIHQQVQACLRQADRGALNAAPDRQALVMLGLALVPDSFQHPAFQKLLQRTRAGHGYDDELNALPDEFWESCARPDEAAT
ncbi:MAG: hypothetical protein C0487_18300 [Leptothrix sp. (in: Bacteria)]|nr:hypothetical protein [Leptothrix sp. (in: b-proteobacteria)]